MPIDDELTFKILQVLNTISLLRLLVCINEFRGFSTNNRLKELLKFKKIRRSLKHFTFVCNCVCFDRCLPAADASGPVRRVSNALVLRRRHRFLQPVHLRGMRRKWKPVHLDISLVFYEYTQSYQIKLTKGTKYL